MSCWPNDREGPDCTLETPMRMGERVTARKLQEFALDINTAHKIRVRIPLSCFISVQKTIFQQDFEENRQPATPAPLCQLSCCSAAVVTRPSQNTCAITILGMVTNGIYSRFVAIVRKDSGAWARLAEAGLSFSFGRKFPCVYCQQQNRSILS